jgi:site-specific DNA-cytosine methylase
VLKSFDLNINLKISPCLMARNPKRACHDNPLVKDSKGIRVLTPKECFSLMGFVPGEINLNGLSDTALYEIAGNGWDINLVTKIFEKLFAHA